MTTQADINNAVQNFCAKYGHEALLAALTLTSTRDLVERLRHIVHKRDITYPENNIINEYADLCAEAANEIDRLTAAAPSEYTQGYRHGFDFASAEMVGKIDPPIGTQREMSIYKLGWHEGRKHERKHCARLAEMLEPLGYERIADAIRALKDEA